MGIKCQIFRDVNNDIEQVVAQNGRPSKLYQDLVLETKDNELALKLWALYNTEEFLNFATNESGLRIDYDANGEPLVEDLISFVKTQVPTLNTTDYLNLSKNLISLGNIDFSEFVNRLGSTFYNAKGVFTISKNRLETSKLYNKAEIENILTDKVLQKNVKSFVDKIMFRSTTDAKLLNINESLTGDSKSVILNNSVNGIGKFDILSNSEIVESIKPFVVGISEKSEFDRIINTLPNEPLVNTYNSDSVFADSLFDQLSNIKSVPQYVIRDGELVSKQEISTKDNLLTSLDRGVVEDSFVISDNVDFLKNIDDEIWQSSPQEIYLILNDIEKDALKYGIDLVGLSEVGLSKERVDTIAFLDYIDKFIEDSQLNNISEFRIRELGNMIDYFLDRPNTQRNTYIKDNSQNRNKKLIELNTTIPDTRLFKRYGLIKFSDNTYQRVNSEKSLNELITETYNVRSVLDSKIPNSIKNSSDFESFQSNLIKYLDSQIDRINYVDSSMTLEDTRKLILLSNIHGSVEIFKQTALKEDTVDSFVTDYMDFGGNLAYLSTDFVVDFNKEILKEKFNESTLYNEALKWFDISDNTVSLKTNNSDIISKINLLLPNTKIYNDFRDFSKLSKNPQLSNFATVTQTQESYIPYHLKRAYYVNNKSSLNSFKGAFTLDNNLLHTSDTTDVFIRVGNGIYELIRNTDGVSEYELLQGYETNSDLNILVPVDLNLVGETNDYIKSLERVTENYTTTKNKLSKSESSEIESIITC